jgi:hypothetical protein
MENVLNTYNFENNSLVDDVAAAAILTRKVVAATSVALIVTCAIQERVRCVVNDCDRDGMPDHIGKQTSVRSMNRTNSSNSISAELSVSN